MQFTHYWYSHTCLPNDVVKTGTFSSNVVEVFFSSWIHRIMQRRSPVARVFNGVPSSARTSSSPNATPAPPELDDRAALIAFAWNIRDMVSSNMSTFEAFTPNQMKEFAANMANAFEKFTLELEAITQERDEIVRLSLACYLLRFPTCDKAFLQRRDLDESMLLLRDREQVALKLSSALAAAHAVRCHESQAQ